MTIKSVIGNGLCVGFKVHLDSDINLEFQPTSFYKTKIKDVNRDISSETIVGSLKIRNSELWSAYICEYFHGWELNHA